MRRFTLFWGALLMVSTLSFAQQRSADEAAALAAQFVNGQPALRKAHRAAQTAGQMQLAHTRKKASQDENAFYVFNRADNAGFIVVSADERTAEDVLFYSDGGQFDMEKINPNLRWWLERFEHEISSIPADEPVTNRAPEVVEEVTPIAPLLVNKDGVEITWYQETPYNNLCPMDALDNTRCLTGCVATAAAQVMYHWRWPAQGTGSSSYIWEDCTNLNWKGECTQSTQKELSCNYADITFEWDNMVPSYAAGDYTTAQANAVAKLMYACGVASEMGYGGQTIGGSGTLTDYMAYGLNHYFNYKYTKFITMYPETYMYQGENYGYGPFHGDVHGDYDVTAAEFKAYFNTELEAGRPIIMGGGSQEAGGHEFVCDGRNKNNYFHINWGWEGESNGYTPITTLKPAGTSYKFNDGLDAILGLLPNWPENVENVQGDNVQSTKVLRDGHVFIQRGDALYTLTGQEVK